MSREQNALKREIEEELDEMRRRRERAQEKKKVDDWEIFAGWDEDVEDENEFSDDGWEDEDDDDEDDCDKFWDEYRDRDCRYPIEDVRQARELLWGKGRSAEA